MKDEFGAGTVVKTASRLAANRAGSGRWMYFFLSLVSSFILHPSSFAGDVPAAINYQGTLADSEGHAVTSGYYHIEFRIWDHETQSGEGNLIWGREFPLHVASGGVFRILLTDDGGEVRNPSPQTNDLRQAFQDKTRYLGLTLTRTPLGQVTDPEEFSPRQPLVAVPYAFHSEHVVEVSQASGPFRVEGGLAVVSGGLVVSNAVEFKNELAVSGMATVEDSLVTENVLTVHGDTTLHSLHVGVYGSRFDSAVEMAGNLVVESPSAISGNGTIPIGGIIPWSGATNAIPDGWALCNGGIVHGHQTPDLRNRFVVGAGSSYDVGNTGGENTHVLTINEMPSHHHGYTVYDEERNYSGTETGGYFWKNTTSSHTTSNGSSQPHENRPPYYAICFIMRVK